MLRRPVRQEARSDLRPFFLEVLLSDKRGNTASYGTEFT